MKITSIGFIDTDQLFNPAGDPSFRTWRGRDNLRVRDIGDWGGENVRGVVGALEGRYDKRFVRWCTERDMLFIRTVDLFWAFENYRNGFYRGVDIRKLRKRWKEDKSISRMTLPNPAAQRQWREERDPGPWNSYYRREREYFLNELARYKRALKFWRECGQQARDSFLRCARYSNRQADAHPDYLVALRDDRARVLDFGFVEVKGPRESLRPSQKRFFPELVRCAGQKVWLVRVPTRGNNVNFGQFTATGEVRPCSTLQSKSLA